MEGNVGIIAFAFGQQMTEAAGPSNEAIAQIASVVRRSEQSLHNEVFLATQWEVALCCDEGVDKPDLQVSAYGDPETHYIDTKGVLDASLKYFRQRNVKRVILVGHPFHLWFIRLLIATKLWRIGAVQLDTRYDERMIAVPYDRSPGNRQSWTRGPVVFVAYLVKALLTKKHGN